MRSKQLRVDHAHRLPAEDSTDLREASGDLGPTGQKLLPERP